jgi:glycosyltransferase involved in cell wall biosynthesis
MVNTLEKKSFSAIVPARNAGKFLPKLFETFSQQSEKIKEIIVIDFILN